MWTIGSLVRELVIVVILIIYYGWADSLMSTVANLKRVRFCLSMGFLLLLMGIADLILYPQLYGKRDILFWAIGDGLPMAIVAWAMFILWKRSSKLT